MATHDFVQVSIYTTNEIISISMIFGLGSMAEIKIWMVGWTFLKGTH